jgi:hypothetical protein
MKTALVVLAVTALAALAYHPARDPLPQFPRTVVWAWERPEKLDFINPREVGVAFLARTIYIRGGMVSVRPRLQPLVVAPETALMAVVRIESQGVQSASRAKVEHAILEATELRGIRALQIDYDAKRSERDFYRGLLVDLHRVLPSSMPLSITALASWCESDNWIANLPVTEAVPMLFRMGAGEAYHPGEDFRPGVCRSSVGVSTDEPLPEFPHGRRVYIFHPRSWSAVDLHAAVHEVQRWE